MIKILVKLSNPEFKYLFRESSTIKSQLIYLVTNSCLLCGNVYESKDEFNLRNIILNSGIQLDNNKFSIK